MQGVNTYSYLSFISAARIQYDIFYNPRAQRTGVHPHTSKRPHTNKPYRCTSNKNSKKITLTRAHTRNTAKKITDTKKVLRKLLYELLCTHYSKTHTHQQPYKEVDFVCVSAVCTYKG